MRESGAAREIEFGEFGSYRQLLCSSLYHEEVRFRGLPVGFEKPGYRVLGFQVSWKHRLRLYFV